jgi:hypothetical protein
METTTTNTIKITPTIGIITAAIFGIVFMMLIFFTGCKKDEPQGNNKPITVQCMAQGLQVQPLTKSWSITDWIFNYNPNQYELKFTGTHGNVYTFNKSIAELQSGFAITVLPDTYTVTYTSTHIGTTTENPLSQTLDISINDTKMINTITPVILDANHTDYLIIVDVNELINSQIMYAGNWYQMFNSPDPNKTYKYAYSNVVGDVDIKYTFYNSITSQNQTLTKTLTNAQLNNIYHMLSSFNGSTTINILPFDYNVIGW